MKNILKLLSLTFILILISCQTKTQTPKVKEAKPVTAKVAEIAPKINDVDATFKLQITAIYDAYNTLKDALVASDAKASVSAANQVLAALDKGDMSLLKKPESHKVWMSQKPILKQNLNKMIGDASLADQRTAFLEVSNSMIVLVENFGTSHELMVQFCPMAADFKGGFWLSTDAAIKNPYFGDKMLTCGSTKRIIK
ncbi:MAG: DUF3347 domain-containing protein [Flavobacteriaceae bacterium]|nr:DUF3347 domain-containing protein [Flavobacteriaceae bacterium]